jgi:Transaldolase/Fructose-6-phosphate aldolase
MAAEVQAVLTGIEEGQTLAVADRILTHPEPGRLLARLDALIVDVTESGARPELISQTLVRLAMNFAGRDAEIVGYSAQECQAAFDHVLKVAAQLKGPAQTALRDVVRGFLSDMKSVNRADSLPGLLAERIESSLNESDPAGSFLKQVKQQIRSGVYWRMIGEGYAKFGNDYARGLETLRHYGFCQVSTNPVLAAKAFDEDPKLTEELQAEIEKRSDWQRDSAAHSDEMALAATLIALWPNLSVFRPLALHSRLKDYMVSFQLNPNIADQEEASLADARYAYQLAADYLKRYDQTLGLGAEAGKTGPNIVFKIAASSEAARNITVRLNSEGIGTNNTVVYSASQEVQLILDAFRGKAEAIKKGRLVTRTYETNMGGRFVSHLREVAAEQLYATVAKQTGEARTSSLLDSLARSLKVEDATVREFSSADVARKARAYCSFKYLKALDHPEVVKAAEAAGQTGHELRQLEDDFKKAGTLVARRVYQVFYTERNRRKWIAYLGKNYALTSVQAEEVLNSMDVLPASKRIPEDTFHALGARNMCHTEFPNQARAVQLVSEKETFRLEEYRESVLGSYDPMVVERLAVFPDFRLGFDLTPSLKKLLLEAGIEEVAHWGTEGIPPERWHEFGPVQKTSAEFRAAYTAFAAKCVSIAKGDAA